MQAGGSSGAIDPLVARTYLMTTGWDAAALPRYARFTATIWNAPRESRRSLITQSWAPKVTRVLPRGNWQDETGEVVQPHPPAFLPQLKGLEGKRQTRLDWPVGSSRQKTRSPVGRSSIGYGSSFSAMG